MLIRQYNTIFLFQEALIVIFLKLQQTIDVIPRCLVHIVSQGCLQAVQEKRKRTLRQKPFISWFGLISFRVALRYLGKDISKKRDSVKDVFDGSLLVINQHFSSVK